MFQVFCRSPKKRSRWVEYSGLRKTKKEAEIIKQWAENQRTCDLDGNLIIYEVREIAEPVSEKKLIVSGIAERHLEDIGFAGTSAEDEEPELSDEQVSRIDEIHNAVYEMCRVMTEEENLDWNMAYIGEIADFAAELLAAQGHRVRYPAIVDDADGSQHIEDYLEPADFQKN